MEDAYKYAKRYTSELIYYCEYDDDDWDNRFEILFSNKYYVESQIDKDLKDNEELVGVRRNIFLKFTPISGQENKNFFGKNILSLTAIAGRNGVGKTSIFSGLAARGFSRNKVFQVYKGNFSFKEYITVTSNTDIDINVEFCEEKSIKSTKNVASRINILFVGMNKGYLPESNIDELRIDVLKPSPINLYTCLVNDKLFQEQFSFTQNNKPKKLVIDLKLDNNVFALLERGLKYRLSDDSSSGVHLSNEDKIKLILLLALSTFVKENRVSELQEAMKPRDNDFIDCDLISRLKLVLYKEGILIRTKNPFKYPYEILSFEAVFNKIYQLFNEIPPEFVLETKKNFPESCLVIDLSIWNKNVHSFLKFIDSFTNRRDYRSSVFNYDFGGYSSGENALLQTIASIKTALKKYDEIDTSVILCIDEYETHYAGNNDEPDTLYR